MTSLGAGWPGWSRALGEAAMVAGIAVLVYAAVLSPTFAFLDDFAFLDLGQAGDPLLWKIQVGAGRPLNAVLINLGFSNVSDVPGLWVLRAVSIVGLGAAAGVLHLLIRRAGGTRWASGITSLLVITAASCQVFASWAQYFAAPWAMAIAALAALVLPRQIARTPKAWGRIAGASLLVSLAVLIYQPAAMFFVVGVTASALWVPATARALWQRGAAATIAFIMSLVVGFLATSAGRRIYDIGGDRTQLTSDFGNKAHWFVSEVLVRAFTPLRVIVPLDVSMSLAVGSFVLLGLAAFFWGPWRDATSRWLFVVIAMVAASAPVLATAENWASARALVGPMTMALLLIALAIRGLARLSARSPVARRRVTATLLVTATAVGIVKASYNTATYFVVPQSIEWSSNQTKLRAVLRSKPTAVRVAGREWYATLAPGVGYDEFGLPSTSAQYVLGPLIRITAREAGLVPPTVLAPGDKRSSRPPSRNIDLAGGR